MPISKGFIDFRVIKAAVSMEQVLDHYGLKEKLRPIGDDSLTGCCPIHQGHNPTQFRVSLSKQCWKCFSECLCGGNVLDFIAKMEKVPIYEAAKLAAEWFEVPLEDTPPNDAQNKAQRRRQASTSADSASPPAEPPPKQTAVPKPESNEPNPPLAFQLKNLNPTHPYFAKRGLTPESVALFGLGHCTKGILNGRIAIPIHNGQGDLVAYAGRWPGEPPEEKPKYQLPKGFRKSLEVFNLHRARETDPSSPLIIVEGFFDCMKVWQAGIRRVIALMGSALAPAQEEQITKMVGHRGQIALMLDEDEAGLSAREHALRRFASLAYVRVIELRSFGRQPDELSAEQIQELILHDEIESYQTEEQSFPLGQLVATSNALRILTEIDIRTAIARHVRRDWGDLCPEDSAANLSALALGGRLFSIYHTPSGLKFYIVTEADRSATTVLLPEDY